MLVYYFTYFLTLKIEAKCSSETLVAFHRMKNTASQKMELFMNCNA
jgi:hypothetical protein